MDQFDYTDFEVGICRYILFRLDNADGVYPNPESDCPGEQSLACWSQIQHRDYKRFKQGTPTDMTQDRSKILIEVGFPLKLGHDERWNMCYGLVSSFKNETGHTRIPRAHKVKGIKIGDWVHNQRKAFKAQMSGGSSSLTSLRIDRLNSIQFEWNLNDWDAMYKELQKFKDEHSHCLVPREYDANNSLGRWVATQRMLYKSKMAGEKSTITSMQIAQLNSLGFVWAINKG
ncbi:hypothetical protein ACHAXR_009345 [Thalassiosira sp. AJA248-18]